MGVSFLALFSLILSLSSHPLSISAASQLDDLCNMLGGWYVTPELCHSILDSDPKSRTADQYGIGVIAANIAVTNATSISEGIQRLLSNASSGTDQQKALKTCLRAYKDAVPALKGVVESMKVKNYTAAETVLSPYGGFLKVPGTCDDAIKDDATYWTVLNHYDVVFSDVTYVAHAIADYIARYGD